jgi:hypothetical protein
MQISLGEKMKDWFRWSLAMAYLLTSCNSGTDLNGESQANKNIPKVTEQQSSSEKDLNSSDAELERELDSMPPELIGGTYLTEMRCGRLKETGNSLPQGYALCGCGFYRKDTNQPVKVGKLRQEWTLTNNGRVISHEQLAVPSSSNLVSAFVVKDSDLNAGLDLNVSLSDKNGVSASFGSQWQSPGHSLGSGITINNSNGGVININ